LLADLDLADTVVTADALQTHRDAAEFLVVAKRAHLMKPTSRNNAGPCGMAGGAAGSRYHLSSMIVRSAWQVMMPR
jgi:hypothetical protein